MLRPWYTFSVHNYTFLPFQCNGQSQVDDSSDHVCEGMFVTVHCYEMIVEDKVAFVLILLFHILTHFPLDLVKIKKLSGQGKCVMKLSSDRIDVGSSSDPSSYGRGGGSTCGAIRGSLRFSSLSPDHPITSARLQLIR